MAINKNALLRYRVLDRCFSNPYRKFFINDLIEACSEALSDYSGEGTSISRRQIYDDINFMKSEAGYAAPIESYRDGRRAYYRYSDRDFSIDNRPLNPEETEQLANALEVLSRVKGLPGFQWMQNLEAHLRNTLDEDTQPIISFQENEFLVGKDHLQRLYNYIKNKQVLDITYQGFSMDKPEVFEIHPYYLKQYNNRWYVFGWNAEEEKLYNLPLDRIESFTNKQTEFRPCDFNFDEYFDDIVGVTNDPDAEVVEVILEAKNEIVLPYIISKPLHGSQKVKDNIIRLEVKINYELKSLIRSFGNQLEVLEPLELKKNLWDS